MEASQRHPVGNDAAPVTDGAMRSQTCVEFLHIMKEFSESSCDASEAVQRVDSLVSQDAQLLRLFPLSRKDQAAADGERLSTDGSTDGSTSSSTTSSSSDDARPDDELQRWIELDLELDQRMDMLDFHHEQQHLDIASGSHKAPLRPGASASTSSSSPLITAGRAPATTSAALPKSFMAVLKSTSRPAPSMMLMDKKRSLAAALLDENEDDSPQLHDLMMADAAAGVKRQRLAVGHALYRASGSRPQQHHEEASDSESKTVDDDDAIVWGMENDGYEQDLLASIDHAVLCDRENRFLQWDLEMEAQHQHQHQHQQQQQQQQHVHPRTVNTATSIAGKARAPAVNGVAVSTVGSRNSEGSSASSNAATSAVTTPSAAFKKLVMSSSPRAERMSKSPSNVDIVEDWSSIDFGTFQNRTVSHILSSCLHKRKLHHPYKNQVQLVNFSVPGEVTPGSGNGGANADATMMSSTPVAGAPGVGATAVASTATNGLPLSQHQNPQQLQTQQHQLGGSLASSLAFGGQDHGAVLGAFVPLLAGPDALSAGMNPSSTNPSGLVSSASGKGGKGEKKQPKKREERKRLLLKMQETFADLEGTFTEQDLDVKGIVGPGGAVLSKLALAKLENLPLPDLANLPQDLRELKRKIEATEHKVEGTKHRHRKGGPCPRCQVQNQLRAAKRAYHKRAVAHKKLPHVAAASAAAAAAAIAASESLAAASAPANAVDDIDMPMAGEGDSGSDETVSVEAISSPPTAISAPAVVMKAVEMPSVVKMEGGSSTKMVGMSATEPVAVLVAPPRRLPTAALHLSDGAGRAMAASLLASSPSLSPSVAPASGPAITPSPLTPSFASRSARPCGNSASSSSSAVSSRSVSPTSSTSPSTSPEVASSSSPPIQHVAVSSA